MYRLIARDDPHLTTEDGPFARLTVDAGGRSDVVLQLAPQRPDVFGVVLDPSGRPAAGARIIAPTWTGAESTLSDADGEFAFYARFREPEVFARKGQLASAFAAIPREPGAPPRVTLQLGPSGVSGVVVDGNGAPLPGANVWLNACCGRSYRVAGRQVIADADGRFAFDVPGGDYLLSVRRTDDDDYLDEDDKPVQGGDRNIRMVLP